jgi:hypothetical protein
MTTVGPVCHLPPNTTASFPDPKDLPGVPPAQPNLASLTATVNALRQLVLILAGLNGPPGSNGKSAPSGSWTQKSIQTETVRIYQNNDPSTGNFVDVQRVTQLVMGNSASKQTWTYNAPPSNGQ